MSLALLDKCSFCQAEPSVRCDIEGKRKTLGEPTEAQAPFWERGVHYQRWTGARDHYKDLPPLHVAMLLALEKERALAAR